jgi:hypothetical protein
MFWLDSASVQGLAGLVGLSHNAMKRAHDIPIPISMSMISLNLPDIATSAAKHDRFLPEKPR